LLSRDTVFLLLIFSDIDQFFLNTRKKLSQFARNAYFSPKKISENEKTTEV